MKTYVDKKVSVIQSVLVSTICNICKNEIVGKYYYEITAGHHDWGNDSIESIEYEDICSADCLRKRLEAYLEAERGTQYINIERS
jgi:hypothetical protein